MSMSIIILGTGAFARECYLWTKDSILGIPEAAVIGFIGPFEPLEGYPEMQRMYLGSEVTYEFKPEDMVVVGVGTPEIRRKYMTFLKERQIKTITIIHPTAYVGDNVVFEDGNIVCPRCVFTRDIKIGEGNLFNIMTSIGHDVDIGTCNVIYSHVDVTGGCKIGDFNLLGSGSRLLPGVSIGNSNKISAGSVVYRNVGDDYLVHGNPAKKMAASIGSKPDAS